MDNRQKQRIEKVNLVIYKIPYIEIKESFVSRGLNIIGKIEVSHPDLKTPLIFEVWVKPQYPFRFQGEESIKFINEDLLPFSHIMEGGSICIHTSHFPSFEKKLSIDFQSLYEWIEKYYINGNDDNHYEHIITPHSFLEGLRHSYCFTQMARDFERGDFGYANLTMVNETMVKGHKNLNFLIKELRTTNGQIFPFEWNTFIKNLPIQGEGIFYFTETAPANYDRFVYEDWIYFKEIFTQNFLNFLHTIERSFKKSKKEYHIPLFLGYKIPNNEIYWQTAILKSSDFPIIGTPVRINGKKTGRWQSTLIEQEIIWGSTKDCSYKYFYGRGKFDDSLTNKKILILGIGAIGSIVAKTLVKSGCRRIDVSDFDIKEPENVCRSEYTFSTGRIDKVEEISAILLSNSPFIETKILNAELFEYYSKLLAGDNSTKHSISHILNEYDVIFDCTTDNDLMHILDGLNNLKAKIINISITNKATSLVCAFNPNVYRFVTTQFQSILENDISELYEPTGCWSPTFKASYNDINTLVQNALRIINKKISSDKELRNFTLYYENEFDIKYLEY